MIFRYIQITYAEIIAPGLSLFYRAVLNKQTLDPSKSYDITEDRTHALKSLSANWNHFSSLNQYPKTFAAHIVVSRAWRVIKTYHAIYEKLDKLSFPRL